jgi:hypothetical protein
MNRERERERERETMELDFRIVGLQAGWVFYQDSLLELQDLDSPALGLRGIGPLANPFNPCLFGMVMGL